MSTPAAFIASANEIWVALPKAVPPAETLAREGAAADLLSQPCGFGVVTLHRPSNVDDIDVFRRILAAIETIAERLPVVFPVHPRTRQRMREFGLDAALRNVTLTDPLGYIDFLSLTPHARLILTDSGGLQEESTALGIPCLTLRDNTERPITVTHGTNQIVGTDTSAILAGFGRALSPAGPALRPELWDGHTAERITRVLCRFLAN